MLCPPARSATNTLPAPINHATTIDLQTTEFPPYSSESLPGQGIASIIVRAAFAHENMAAHIIFRPWQRSLQNFNTNIAPGTGHRPDAIFPVYDDTQNKRRFLLSRAIVRSAVGFVYYRGAKFDWQTLDDLTDLTIGTVRGYTTREDFDQYVQQEKLHVVETHDDATLLRLLSAGRVDVAVMDQQVMRHILDTNQDFDQNRRWFYFHPTILENKTLHVGFHRTPEGKMLRDAFDHGLRALQCPDDNCPAQYIPNANLNTQ
ncbi:hypothetical protein LF95_11555 [Thalassospira sp. TSL5-1]|nr:hypothetical protein LF95_11555 [Thalassospira sp. TSL5-1]